MKIYSNLRLALIATTLLLSLTVVTFGQGRHFRTSAREGFWVVEWQPKKKCVVYFYSNDNQLIYQEVLAKKQLNIKRAATQESLGAVLEQALRQWSLNQKSGNDLIPTNQQWLAAEFRK